MSSHPSIFREYDVRGVAGKTLFAEDAFAIGQAFAAIIRQDKPVGAKLCVAYDGRLSSPELRAELCRGIELGGVGVIDVGLGPTPMLYFSVFETGADGGIMVTGSHNPPTHNGFKFMRGKKPFFGEGIQQIRMAIEKGEWETFPAPAQESRDVRDAYLNLLEDAYSKRVKGSRALKVAWDPGNGATGEIVARLVEMLPGEHIVMNEVIDGTFPVHHPDPSEPENLKDLIAAVVKNDCDIGIAFDGDGDRIGVIDNEGGIIWGDQLISLLAEDVLKVKPGGIIIADVKASQVLFDRIAELGGVPLMWKTGHSHIKSKMAEVKAPLAGEMSGHIFFADDFFGYDDAIYAAIRVLAIVVAWPYSIGQWRKALPQPVNTPEIRFECPAGRKFDVVEEVRARLIAAGQEFNDVDGMRVSTPDGWWLLRASNTQEMLTIRCEAGDEAGLERLKNTVKQQLALSHIRLPL